MNYKLSALLIKGMNFSLTQRRKDAKVRVLKVQFRNFIPQYGFATQAISNAKLSIILVLCSTLLTGCFGYPRLLSYPFDSGGRSLNSFSSELNPQISGRYIVFTSDRRGSQDVYMFDTVTRNLVDLPGLNSFDTIASHPAASDNGKFIVFAASRQGRTQIIFYDRDVRQSRNLTSDLPGEVRNPTISADGNRIAFEYSNNGQWDILVYDRFGRKLNIPQDPS